MKIEDITDPRLLKVIDIAKDLKVKPFFGKTEIHINPVKKNRGHNLTIRVLVILQDLDLNVAYKKAVWPLHDAEKEILKMQIPGIKTSIGPISPDHYDYQVMLISIPIPEAPKRRRRIIRPGQPPETV